MVENSAGRNTLPRAAAAITVVVFAATVTACGAAGSTGDAASTSSTDTSSAKAETTLPGRELALEGSHNTRDIGGYTTNSGKTVRWNNVFRSDSLNDLTNKDRDTIAKNNIDTVVDFRGEKEIEQDGADHVPGDTHLVHAPMLGTKNHELSETITTALESGDPDTIEDALGDGEAAERNKEMYADLAGSTDALDGYAKTLRTIADADHAVLYNCTDGKDRTGVMTAVLLGVLGVPDKTITKDFVLSNEYNADANKQTYDHLEKQGADPDLIRPLTEQHRGDIEPLLDKVDKTGGWNEFARQELGLSKTTLTHLRSKLLKG